MLGLRDVFPAFGATQCKDSGLADIIKWPVILVCPGEEELPLLAVLTSRSDAQLIAVADPDPASLGAGLAEVMGVLVVSDPMKMPLGQAKYLVYPALSEQVAPFVDLAGEMGLKALTSREFILAFENPAQSTNPHAVGHLPVLDTEGLETESAAIHRTLSRIEEALDREGLLRWLLGLAIRATGADSGSIMLLDRGTEELYVAFAEGLSQQTMLRTRVRLGEGIAGRVALKKQAEMITSDQHPGARRDRPGQGSAVCAPLVWEGRLLGVLNLSTASEAEELHPDALSVVESLGHRFGLILDRFLRIQRVKDGELFLVMEEGLLREKHNPEALAVTLRTWAGDLESVAGASRVELSVVTAGGDLFSSAKDRSHYESPPPKVKADIIATGKAKVLNPGDLLEDDPMDGLGEGTIFHLPVGDDPVRALFTIEFTSPTRAHHFRSICSDILALVGRHLEDYLDRAEAADQVDRLTTLSSTLSDLVLVESQSMSQQKVIAAAMRLTGADHAMVLDSPAETSLPDMPVEITTAGVKLLQQTGDGRWHSTVLESATAEGCEPRAVLAVPLSKDAPFPGLILWDKRRLHPLDSAVFTEMDVLFTRRLLPLLAVAQKSNPMASDSPPKLSGASQSSTDDILAVLKREMDRCDRYHTCLGLTAYQPRTPGEGVFDPEAMVGQLAAHLRTSDQVFAWGANTLLVLVPEDVQSLPRLQKRIMNVLENLTGPRQVEFKSAVRTYPGAATSPITLMEAVLGALD